MPEVTGSSPVSSTINRGRALTVCSFAREPPMKVSVFFDGQNFYRSLQRYDESLRVDYDRLAARRTPAPAGPRGRLPRPRRPPPALRPTPPPSAARPQPPLP